MQYNFDEVINRRGTYSLKWDVPKTELPMWVADMDFETAPEIQESIQNRAKHGVYGYTILPDAWYEAIIGWWSKRHHVLFEKEWLLFSTSVIASLSSIVRKLTTPGEKIVVQMPVYNNFFNSIADNGREVLNNSLKYDGTGYQIDFADLEQKLADPQTVMMVLCNPHNPVGKIWDKETLEQIGELCWKHHVLVVADEIHCDVTAPGKEYVPFVSVSEKCRENSITCIAPTKTFNLAGLQTSAVVVPNARLRHKVENALHTDWIAEPNAFAVDATIAAFTKGEAWLDALRDYLEKNKQTVREFLEKELPQLSLIPSEATYLLWIDCTKLAAREESFQQFLRKEAGLYLSDGGQYGQGGSDFLRLNIACPGKTLQEGLERLKKGVMAYKNQ